MLLISFFEHEGESKLFSTNNYSQQENTYAQPQRTNQIYNSQKVQQVVNNKSNINQQPNPMLQKALDFVNSQRLSKYALLPMCMQGGKGKY